MGLASPYQWTAFCEDGWVATFNTQERAYLIKVGEHWYAQVAHDMTDPPPYDTFKEARNYVFRMLSIQA